MSLYQYKEMRQYLTENNVVMAGWDFWYTSYYTERHATFWFPVTSDER